MVCSSAFVFKVSGLLPHHRLLMVIISLATRLKMPMWILATAPLPRPAAWVDLPLVVRQPLLILSAAHPKPSCKPCSKCMTSPSATEPTSHYLFLLDVVHPLVLIFSRWSKAAFGLISPPVSPTNMQVLDKW